MERLSSGIPELYSAVPEISPPQPELVFSRYVDEVREIGDIVDAYSDLSYQSGALRTLGIIAATTYIGAEQTGPIPGVAAALVSTGLTIGYEVGRTKVFDQKRAEQRRDRAVSAMFATGQNFDVVRTTRRSRTGERRIALIWHGPNGFARQELDLLGALEWTARLAKENDVSELLARQGIISQALPDSNLAATTMAGEWMSQHKPRLRHDRTANDQFQSRTPDEWLELAREARVIQIKPQPAPDTKEKIKKQPLEQYIGALVRLHRSDHKLVKLYDELKEKGLSRDQIRAQLLEKALTVVSMQLEDTSWKKPNLKTAYTTTTQEDSGSESEAGEQAPEVEPTESTSDRTAAVIAESPAIHGHSHAETDDVLTKRKIHSSGSIASDGTVHMHEGGDLYTTTLKGGLGLTKERAKQIVTFASEHPHRAVEALEFLILVSLLEKETPLKDQEESIEERPVIEKPTPTVWVTRHTSYQEQAVRRRSAPRATRLRQFNTNPQRFLRLLLAADLALVATVGLFGAKSIADRDRAAAASIVRTEISSQIGAEPGSPAITDGMVSARLDHESGFWNNWDNITGPGSDIANFLNVTIPISRTDSQAQPPKLPSAVITGSGVGNAGDSMPNQVAWRLNPHGLSPSGYWTVATSSDLYTTTQSGPSLEWLRTARPATNEAIPTQLNFAQQQAGYIAVSRYITNQDISEVPGGYTVEVPVLDGTTIGAASIANSPVPLIERRLTDGTEQLEIIGSNSVHTGNLEYWVVPSTSRVRAVGTISVSGNMPYNPGGIYWDLKALDPSIGNLWDYTPDSLGARVAYDINHRFGYAVNPLPSGLQGVTNVDDAIMRIIKNKEANCNEASTIVGLADPYASIGLGFEDTGKGAQLFGLYTHSGHQYAITSKGQIIDGSPSRMLPGQAAYFSTDSLSSASDQIPNETAGLEVAALTLLVASAGLGGAIYRRRIVEAVNRRAAPDPRSQARDIERWLAEQPFSWVKEAKELAGAAVYGNQQSVLKATARIASTKPKRSKEKAGRDLSKDLIHRTDLNGEVVLERLDQAKKEGSWAKRRVLRKRGRILARAGEAALLLSNNVSGDNTTV